MFCARRAMVLVSLAALAACVQEPSLEGRACSDLSPCPAGYTCGTDLVCHFTCNSDDDCSGSADHCIDSICVVILEGACANGVCLCSGAGECPSGLDCLGGVCSRPTPDTDAGPEPSEDAEPSQDLGTIDQGVADSGVLTPDVPPVLDCDDPADCVTPGPCEELAGATCNLGNCVYARRTCTTPPPSACVSNDTIFRTYSGIGSCDPSTDQCNYQSTDMNCPSCQTMCLDPCGAISCDDFNGGCRDQGFCVPGSPATCNYTNVPDDSACTREADSMPGVCLGGECVECRDDGDCNDNNVCTAESCNLTTHTCTRSNISGPCTDGTACTTNDTCSNGVCVSGAAVTCNNSPGQCFQAAGTCDPLNGLCDYAPRNSGTACNDNSLCTHTDGCNGSGTCRGTAYSCNDSNRCTTDACNGSGGCTHTRIAPDGLAPSGGVSITAMSVVLTWNACSDAAHYDVEIQFESSPGVWSPYFTYDENNPTAPTTATKTFFPCGGASNSDMRFRIRSFNGASHGPWSPFSVFHWANSRAC